MHGAVAGTKRLGCELRPPFELGLQVVGDRGLSTTEAFQARALLVLDFKELQEACPLAGGGDDPQPALGTGQHNSRLGGIEKLRTPKGEGAQEVHHVEVFYQRVGELDEGPDQSLIFSHRPTLLPPRTARLGGACGR
jgi:hypothetical protein